MDKVNLLEKFGLFSETWNPKIAGELGRKDHTTAIHSVEKIEKAIKLDYMVREQVAEIREKLYA